MSEYETQTESEEENTFGVRAIAKPVFVRKSERESILEREKQEAEEEAREEEKVARKEDRKVETRQKITSEILKEQEGGGDEATDWEDMPDDDDEADEAALYEAWRIRELRRVKREFDERAAAAHRGPPHTQRGLPRAPAPRAALLAEGGEQVDLSSTAARFLACRRWRRA